MVILLISASQVARITGVNHQHLIYFPHFTTAKINKEPGTMAYTFNSSYSEHRG
jgi:hypothetical protein